MMYLAVDFLKGGNCLQYEVSVQSTLAGAKKWAHQQWKHVKVSPKMHSVAFIEPLSKAKIDFVIQAERDMRYEIECGNEKSLYIWDTVKEFVDAIYGYLFWKRRGGNPFA